MYFSDQTLAIIASGAGVLATLLGLTARLVWSHVHSKNTTIDALQTRVNDADHRERTLRDERDAAVKARIEAEGARATAEAKVGPLTADRDKWKVAAAKNYTAWKDENTKRLAAEKGAQEAGDAAAKARAGETQAKVAATKATEAVTAAQTALAAVEVSHAEAVTAKENAEEKADRYHQKAKDLDKRLKGVTKQDGRVWQKPIPPDAPVFVPLAARKKPIIISVLNLKGGVGKTTVTANLGGFFGARGKRVLMIDCDHQRSLSQLLLSDAERVSADAAGRTLQRFLTSPIQDGKLLVATSHPVPNLRNCWVITNTDPRRGSGTEMGLDDLETQMMNEWLLNPTKQDVRLLMRGALHSEIVQEQFEFVLCDCPPRLTTASINALAASDFVIVPVQAEAVSIRSVVHVLLRLNSLREAGILPDLRLLGILANMVSGTAAVERLQTDLLDTVVATVAQNKVWTEPIRVFNTKLNRDDRYLKASLELSKGKLKLAIGSEVIEKQFAGLVKEIETAIRDCLGVAKVPVS